MQEKLVKTLTEALQECNLLFNLKNCRKIDAWAVLDSFFNLAKGVSNLETLTKTCKEKNGNVKLF